MNRGERITQYWRNNTPRTVGPGAYNLASVPSKTHVTAPFNRSQERTVNATLHERSPGPGAYSLLLKPSLRGVSFAYGSVRDSPFPRLLNPSPGPGAYSPDVSLPRLPQRRVPRPLAFPRDPSAVSIPSQVRDVKAVGPTEYSPDPRITKPAQLNFSFGKPRGPRSLQPSPGPGAYNPFRNEPRKKTRSWVFLSTAKRLASNAEKSPGPGHYDSPTVMIRERIRQDAFGSAAERDIPLGADPHRPYVTTQEPTPPVGYYSSQEQLAKVASLKQKYVVPAILPQRPAFGTSVARFPTLDRSKYSPSEAELVMG